MFYNYFIKPIKKNTCNCLKFNAFLAVWIFLASMMYQPVKAQVITMGKAEADRILQLERTYQSFYSAGNFKDAARMMNEIALIYKNHNQYQKAIESFEKSLNTNGNTDNINGIGTIYNHIGTLYTSLKKYEKAVDYLSQALSVSRSQNYIASITTILVNRATVFNKQKKYKQSITDLNEALNLSKKINDAKQVENIYTLLSETSKKMGDNEGALKYSNEYKNFKEQPQNIETPQQPAATATPANTDGANTNDSKQSQNAPIQTEQNTNSALLKNLTRTEIEVALKYQQLATEKAAADAAQERTAALENEKLYIKIIACIIIISFAIIAYVVYRNFRKEKEHNAILNAQNIEIARQREHLSELNDVKNKIFSIIAHDLRGPIGSLQSFFAIIDYFENVPDELRVLLDQFKEKNAQISAVLENLLNWAKTQMSEQTANLQPVAILPLVIENINLYDSVATKKGISFINHVPADTKVVTDAEMTRIVIRNLIQNAIKFTHEHGSVILSSSQNKDGTTSITVKDTGVGMSAEKLKTLFSLKSNESTYGTKNEKGTGLGLVLCNDFIKTCGGSLQVSSKPNEGTQITILLKTA